MLVSGCATTRVTPSQREVSIVLRGFDRVDMDGRERTAAQVSSRLSGQVDRDTVIKIERDAGVSGEAMAHLVGTLQRDGFTRVIFVSERHIEIDVP